MAARALGGSFKVQVFRFRWDGGSGVPPLWLRRRFCGVVGGMRRGKKIGGRKIFL
jgi:hypothetical protein